MAKSLPPKRWPLQKSNPLLRRVRWFRFSLATFLLSIAILSYAFYWFGQYEQALEAVKTYQQAEAAFETQTVSPEELCFESERRLRAEVDVPFADQTAAYQEHLQRVTRPENIV